MAARIICPAHTSAHPNPKIPNFSHVWNRAANVGCSDCSLLKLLDVFAFCWMLGSLDFWICESSCFNLLVVIACASLFMALYSNFCFLSVLFVGS